MGNEASKIKTLQIVKIAPDSVSQKNNLLPFMHTILRFNGRQILENADIAKLAFEWEEGDLKLDLLDLRTQTEFSVTVPKKDKDILGMSVKFHQNIIPLFTIHVINVSKGSPAQLSGLVPKDYIIGVEGVSCETESMLLKYIELKKKEGMTLLVFNGELNYIRRVEFMVPSGLGFFGCEIGLGMLYRIPHDVRNISMEYDPEKIQRDTEEIARKYGEEEVDFNEEEILEEIPKYLDKKIEEVEARDVDAIADNLSDYKEEIESKPKVEEEITKSIKSTSKDDSVINDKSTSKDDSVKEESTSKDDNVREESTSKDKVDLQNESTNKDNDNSNHDEESTSKLKDNPIVEPTLKNESKAKTNLEDEDKEDSNLEDKETRPVDEDGLPDNEKDKPLNQSQDRFDKTRPVDPTDRKSDKACESPREEDNQEDGTLLQEHDKTVEDLPSLSQIEGDRGKGKSTSQGHTGRDQHSTGNKDHPDSFNKSKGSNIQTKPEEDSREYQTNKDSLENNHKEFDTYSKQEEDTSLKSGPTKSDTGMHKNEEVGVHKNKESINDEEGGVHKDEEDPLHEDSVRRDTLQKDVHKDQKDVHKDEKDVEDNKRESLHEDSDRGDTLRKDEEGVHEESGKGNTTQRDVHKDETDLNKKLVEDVLHEESGKGNTTHRDVHKDETDLNKKLVEDVLHEDSGKGNTGHRDLHKDETEVGENQRDTLRKDEEVGVHKDEKDPLHKESVEKAINKEDMHEESVKDNTDHKDHRDVHKDETDSNKKSVEDVLHEEYGRRDFLHKDEKDVHKDEISHKTLSSINEDQRDTLHEGTYKSSPTHKEKKEEHKESKNRNLSSINKEQNDSLHKDEKDLEQAFVEGDIHKKQNDVLHEGSDKKDLTYKDEGELHKEIDNKDIRHEYTVKESKDADNKDIRHEFNEGVHKVSEKKDLTHKYEGDVDEESGNKDLSSINENQRDTLHKDENGESIEEELIKKDSINEDEDKALHKDAQEEPVEGDSQYKDENGEFVEENLNEDLDKSVSLHKDTQEEPVEHDSLHKDEVYEHKDENDTMHKDAQEEPVEEDSQHKDENLKDLGGQSKTDVSFKESNIPKEDLKDSNVGSRSQSKNNTGLEDTSQNSDLLEGDKSFSKLIEELSKDIESKKKTKNTNLPTDKEVEAEEPILEKQDSIYVDQSPPLHEMEESVHKESVHENNMHENNMHEESVHEESMHENNMHEGSVHEDGSSGKLPRATDSVEIIEPTLENISSIEDSLFRRHDISSLGVETITRPSIPDYPTNDKLSLKAHSGIDRSQISANEERPVVEKGVLIEEDLEPKDIESIEDFFSNRKTGTYGGDTETFGKEENSSASLSELRNIFVKDLDASSPIDDEDTLEYPQPQDTFEGSLSSLNQIDYDDFAYKQDIVTKERLVYPPKEDGVERIESIYVVEKDKEVKEEEKEEEKV